MTPGYPNSTPRPTLKAALVCLFFMGAGTAGWLMTGAGSNEAFALLAYYIVLVINTFFSIRVFSMITPKNAVQTLFDGAAAIFYFGLAFSFNSTATFAFVSVGLFLLAVAKYVHLKSLMPSSALLRRKIALNTLAGLLSLFSLALALLGFSEIAAWVLGVVFALANVYVLAIKPMYRLDQREKTE